MTIAQTIGRVNASLERSTRSREFSEYAIALMRANGNLETALHYASSPRVRDALKADVAGDTTTSADAIAPYRNLSEGFSSTLTNAAFDGVLSDANIVPMHVVFAIITGDATGALAGEGVAKLMSSVTLGTGTLQERRAAVLVSISDDVLKFSTAARLLENSLRNGISKAVDKIFVDALIAGTTPIASSGNIFQDLRTAMAAAGSSTTSRWHLIVGPGVARNLALASTTDGAPAFLQMTPSGGTVSGISVHASDALSTAAVLVDASQLVMAADAVAIRISQNASLEMSDAAAQAIAAGSPPAPVAATQKVVSMFQTNSTAVLCERRIAFQPLRATAVQSLSGVEWGLVGSPPA